MRSDFTDRNDVTIKKKNIVGENVENLELMYIAGGNVKWFSQYVENTGDSSES